MKNILIVRASVRKNGNSNLLSDSFANGCRDAGHVVTNLYLADYDLNMCLGCYGCESTGICCQKDDMSQLLPLFRDADVLVFSTPVYFYSMAGQLKTFLDRTMPLYFEPFKPKTVYLLTASESPTPSAVDGILKELDGWGRCFDNIVFRGGIYGLGVLKPGDICGKPVLQDAYSLGKEV